MNIKTVQENMTREKFEALPKVSTMSPWSRRWLMFTDWLGSKLDRSDR